MRCIALLALLFLPACSCAVVNPEPQKIWNELFLDFERWMRLCNVTNVDGSPLTGPQQEDRLIKAGRLTILLNRLADGKLKGDN
jgi:hypothetical protein